MKTVVEEIQELFERGGSEPYSKIFEDPAHGWFKEHFSFLKEIPRSRSEFVSKLYDEYLRGKDSDPDDSGARHR